MTVLNRFRATDETEPQAGSPRNQGVTDAEPPATPQTAASDTTPGSSRSRSMESSVIYQLVQRGQGVVTTSWLYEWLTAEPEPDVIVIDLRETRTVGRVLTILDQVFTRAEQDLLPALPTATVTRGGYWLRNRAVNRPLRVVSVGVALVANLGLLGILTGSEDPITPMTLFLLAALLLAARGLQSTMSLEELTAKPWYQRIRSVLIAAFEPPAPPDSPSTDQDTADSTNTETASDSAETTRV